MSIMTAKVSDWWDDNRIVNVHKENGWSTNKVALRNPGANTFGNKMGNQSCYLSTFAYKMNCLNLSHYKHTNTICFRKTISTAQYKYAPF